MKSKYLLLDTNIVSYIITMLHKHNSMKSISQERYLLYPSLLWESFGLAQSEQIGVITKKHNSVLLFVNLW